MKRQQIITAILMLIVAAVAIRGAMKPRLGKLKLTVRGDIAYGNGGTDGWSRRDVNQALDENPQVSTLILKLMPGTKDSATNLKLARDIRKRGLNTHLESNSFIASGAVDLFLAGVERTMECGALIGVHSWSISGARETIRISPQDMGADQFQKHHEAFLRDMGIDPAFYAFTRAAAEPEKLHYMSMDEIKRYGLLTQLPDCD